MFTFINDILHKKSGNSFTKDTEHEFKPYLVQRWITMYSPTMATLLNSTLNFKIWRVIDSNEQWYKLFMTVVPKVGFKRLKYIKKVKEDSKKDDFDDVITMLADNNELSKREILEYVKEFNIDLKEIRKTIRS